MTDGRTIHIPKGAPLCTFTLTRISPLENGTDQEGVDIEFHIHPQLQAWLRGQAEASVKAGRADTLLSDASTISSPHTITARDGGGLEAFNIARSSIVSRSDSPSLRLDAYWYKHLGFLRLAVKTRHRHLRLTEDDQYGAAKLWEPVTASSTASEKEIPRAESYLRQAFVNLKHQHVSWPTTTTTIVAT